MISGPVSRTLRGNTGPVQEGQKPENEESKEYFSVVWRSCRAVAGLASLLGVLLKKCSNINQKTPPSPSEVIT
ncbi:hypothetical protein KJ637_04925, partial [Patescibacteria group bacterium]|nr:hypothetical protein [Patescibacteria group bacterium]